MRYKATTLAILVYTLVYRRLYKPLVCSICEEYVNWLRVVCANNRGSGGDGGGLTNKTEPATSLKSAQAGRGHRQMKFPRCVRPFSLFIYASRLLVRIKIGRFIVRIITFFQVLSGRICIGWRTERCGIFLSAMSKTTVAIYGVFPSIVTYFSYGIGQGDFIWFFSCFHLVKKLPIRDMK